ncbi:MAG: hypothetical protein U0T75_10185 [Chitinophagales bacterium]
MKHLLKIVALVALPLFVLFSANSCKKEQFGNGPISFSRDTLTFDTVFTSLGSTTRYFKVFNDNKKAVRIDDIRLMHLVGNQFRINVDGIPGDQFTGIEIPAQDSIYVFVEVTVDPNNAATPFVIIDDVTFSLNGSTKTVHLQAFGQNAHFHYGETITSSAVWNNDLPHVIIANDTNPGVVVDCGGSLTINPGCKVFFAGNTGIFVEGTLNAVAGTWSDSIVFQGVRLEQYYDDKPGQWFGLVFLRDTVDGSCTPQGFFDHCVITESSYGIYAGAGISGDLNKYILGDAFRPQVTITNSIIKHSQYNAVFGFNAEISAENSEFFVSGDHLLQFALGGLYNFKGCTIFNNGSRYIGHEKETMLLSNLAATGPTSYVKAALTSNFENCVVYGSLQNEIAFSNYLGYTAGTDFSNNFSKCLLRTKEDTLNGYTTGHTELLFNTDPRFKDEDAFNFTPSDSVGYLSPLIDAAVTGAGLGQDIFGNTRGVVNSHVQPPSGKPYDIGAIEVQ